jgi:hypothetical protein
MDFAVFPYIKSFLRGMKFDNLSELRPAVMNVIFHSFCHKACTKSRLRTYGTKNEQKIKLLLKGFKNPSSASFTAETTTTSIKFRPCDTPPRQCTSTYLSENST